MDSTLATLQHSRRVDELMLQLVMQVQQRLTKHDLSKLKEPEQQTFDIFNRSLAGSTYGSDAYMDNLDNMRPALDHHYAHNRHHPEHFVNGIQGMTLVDLIEMIADWKAASERHDNGNLALSMDFQKERFHISDELAEILWNTAEASGWLEQE